MVKDHFVMRPVTFIEHPPPNCLRVIASFQSPVPMSPFPVVLSIHIRRGFLEPFEILKAG